MERSIRSELWSWSRSLTNRSFCGETPRSQVNRGKAAGTVPPPRPPLPLSAPAWPVPPQLIPLLPAVPLSSLPSFLRQSPAGTGCPPRRACGRRWLGLTGSRRQLPGHAWPCRPQSGIERQRHASPWLSPVVGAGGGTGCSACPACSNTSEPGLGAGAGGGGQDRVPGPRGPWLGASKELGKKGKSSQALAAVAHLQGRAASRQGQDGPRGWVPPRAPRSPNRAASRDVGKEPPRVDGSTGAEWL